MVAAWCNDETSPQSSLVQQQQGPRTKSLPAISIPGREGPSPVTIYVTGRPLTYRWCEAYFGGIVNCQAIEKLVSIATHFFQMSAWAAQSQMPRGWDLMVIV